MIMYLPYFQLARLHFSYSQPIALQNGFDLFRQGAYICVVRGKTQIHKKRRVDMNSRFVRLIPIIFVLALVLQACSAGFRIG